MRFNCTFNKIMITMLAVVMILTMAFCNVGEIFAVDTFERNSVFNVKVDGKTVKNRTYNHSTKFKNCLILDGLDMSAWQDSDTDFDKIKNAGADYVILKVSGSFYGSGKQYKDANFKTFYTNAKKAGLMVGAYVFSQATTTTEAKNEVEYAVNLLKSYDIKPSDLELPVYMDYEFSGANDGGRLCALEKKLGKSKFKTRATDCVKAFCDTMKSAGYNTGLYANTSFLNNSCDGATLGKTYEIWCAQYYTKCEFTGDYNMWQYSSSGVVSGVTGTSTADVNFWYLDKNRKAASDTDVAACVVNKKESDLIVQLNGDALKKNTDYILSYIDTDYAILRGLGKYSGYKVIDLASVKDMPADNSAETDIIIEPTPVDHVIDVELPSFSVGTKVSAVKSAAVIKDDATGYSMKVLDKNGKALSSKTVVTTGDQLAVYDPAGMEVATVTISVKGSKAKFKSVKGGKKIQLKWGKLASSKATGYQVQYCLYKDMPSEYVGTKTYKSYKTVSAKLSTNYKGTYYVRIRSYKTIRSKKNYSAWSAVKSVKIK